MVHGSEWDPPIEVQEDIRQYVSKVVRVLGPSGKWLYITFRQPHFVVPQLLCPGVWDVVTERLEGESGGFEYFAYILTKQHG